MKIPEFYKVIHQDNSTNHYLVLNEITNEVCLLKILKNYDKGVFFYLKSINSNSIPRIYDLLEDNGELMVIEEYIKGDTLEDLLIRNALTDTDKKKILLELCDCLDVLHKAPKPIIHRDLKTTNIMRTNDGVIKLIDYDAAKVYHEGSSKDTVLLGTPDVAAPEQYGFAQSDARTDIYAMGKLISRLFPDNNYMKKIATKATNLDPRDRYQTIAELRNALNGNNSTNFISKILVPPGFRTGTWWHMLIAIPYYLTSIFIIIVACFGNMSKHNWPIGRFFFFLIETTIIFFSIVDLEFNWTGLWAKFPYVKSKEKTQHIIAGIVIWLIIVILFRLANAYLVDLIFPYYL